jgi:hypothetical protein
MRPGAIVGGLIAAAYAVFWVMQFFSPSLGVDTTTSLAMTRECMKNRLELREDVALTKQGGKDAIGLDYGNTTATVFYYSSEGAARRDAVKLKKQAETATEIPAELSDYTRELKRAYRSRVVQSGPMVMAFQNIPTPGPTRALAGCAWLAKSASYSALTGMDMKELSRPLLNLPASKAQTSPVGADMIALHRPGDRASAYLNNIIDIVNDAAPLSAEKGAEVIRQQVPPLLSKALPLYPKALAKIESMQPKTETGRLLKPLVLEAALSSETALEGLQEDLSSSSLTWQAITRFGTATEAERKREDKEIQAIFKRIPPAERQQMFLAMAEGQF